MKLINVCREVGAIMGLVINEMTKYQNHRIIGLQRILEVF